MICPRCASDQVNKMVDSPVGKEWEVYVCEKCWFSWRSTEKIEIPEQFKLNDEKFKAMQAIPPVPPLKRTSR